MKKHRIIPSKNLKFQIKTNEKYYEWKENSKNIPITFFHLTFQIFSMPSLFPFLPLWARTLCEVPPNSRPDHHSISLAWHCPFLPFGLNSCSTVFFNGSALCSNLSSTFTKLPSLYLKGLFTD